MGVPSLNDLAVDGTLNTTNKPTNNPSSIKITRVQINLFSEIFTKYDSTSSENHFYQYHVFNLELTLQLEHDYINLRM